MLAAFFWGRTLAMDREHAAEDDVTLFELIEQMIEMYNRLGHELIAVQSVCAHLLAEQCA